MMFCNNSYSTHFLSVWIFLIFYAVALKLLLSSPNCSASSTYVWNEFSYNNVSKYCQPLASQSADNHSLQNHRLYSGKINICTRTKQMNSHTLVIFLVEIYVKYNIEYQISNFHIKYSIEYKIARCIYYF